MVWFDVMANAENASEIGRACHLFLAPRALCSDKGIWTFAQDYSAAGFDDLSTQADEGLRGRIEVGIDLTGMNQSTFGLGLSGFYDGLGDKDYQSWGGKVELQRRF